MSKHHIVIYRMVVESRIVCKSSMPFIESNADCQKHDRMIVADSLTVVEGRINVESIAVVELVTPVKMNDSCRNQTGCKERMTVIETKLAVKGV